MWGIYSEYMFFFGGGHLKQIQVWWCTAQTAFCCNRPRSIDPRGSLLWDPKSHDFSWLLPADLTIWFGNDSPSGRTGIHIQTLRPWGLSLSGEGAVMPMDLEAALEDEAWPPGPPGLRFSLDFPDPKRDILEGAVEIIFMGINMILNPARCVFRVPYGYSYRNPFVTSTAPPSTHSSQVVIAQNPQCSGSSWNIRQIFKLNSLYIYSGD